jgi:hypothetical protein
MDEIRYGQEKNTSKQYYGFVPAVVPSAVIVGKPLVDISWTAAYPLITHWLLRYYGDEAVVRDHWGTMKLWVDAQKREMKPGDGALLSPTTTLSTLTLHPHPSLQGMACPVHLYGATGAHLWNLARSHRKAQGQQRQQRTTSLQVGVLLVVALHW